jgi:hypothetical protein
MRALGLASPTVRARVAAGRLHRIHHGVYSLVPKELLKREGLYMAAVLACGPGAVLSHRSAAALLELRDWGATKIEVTVPRRSSRRHEGIAVHRSTTLTAQDITVVNNIPCTSIARTLLDLAEVVTHRQLERAFDQAEIAEVFDLRAIEDVLARNPTRRGVRITRPLGIPDPEANTVLVLEGGGPPIRPDFVWREQRVVLEADSGKWHGSRQRMEIDRRRDQRLTAAGWKVIRTTWRQMKYRPHELRRVLLKLLAPESPDGND